MTALATTRDEEFIPVEQHRGSLQHVAYLLTGAMSTGPRTCCRTRWSRRGSPGNASTRPTPGRARDGSW